MTIGVGLVAARFTGCRVDALRWFVLFLFCSLADFLYFRVMPLCDPCVTALHADVPMTSFFLQSLFITGCRMAFSDCSY